MRKLLVLLSLVLLFALCQSQVIEKGRKLRPDFCPFGFTKVNGTKVCKSFEDFLKHPRNATNCTNNKILKCRKFNNKTLCFCLPKYPLRPRRNITLCKPGEFYRCKFDKSTGQRDCKCRPMGPKIIDVKELDCPLGSFPKCKGRRCICAKDKKNEREPFKPVEFPVPKLEPIA
jgi:hypothetical protein